jgi:hypothetical protein
MAQITIQYFDGCPNWRHLHTTVIALMSELGVNAAVELQRVDSQEEAVKVRFRGSPTLLVGGVDPFADEDAPFGLGCRVYRTESGIAGEPPEDEIRAALIKFAS